VEPEEMKKPQSMQDDMLDGLKSSFDEMEQVAHAKLQRLS
jgi:hypothetical protein